MKLEDAKKIIFEKKPDFKELYLEYKNKTWLEYAQDKFPKDFITTDRSEELISILSSLLLPLLGEEKTKQTVETLQKSFFVSSADHSGVLCHPFFSNSALVRSTNKEAVISFTCGGVSLTNSSYPRGIFFHDDSLNLVKIPFVSLAGRRRSVYGLPAFSKTKIGGIYQAIDHLNLKTIPKEKLKRFLVRFFKSEALFKQSYFSDQLTILNDILWNEIFGNERGNLVYIEAEKVVRELFLKKHLDEDTLINKVLFDATARSKYIAQFEGVVGAHNTSKNSGSHLFWYLDPKKNSRVQLFVNGNSLQSMDGSISIELTAAIVRKHLEEYSLIPSMALCYSILSFYYGLMLGGGFSQISYLKTMKEAWSKTVEGLETFASPQTNVFTGEFVLCGIHKEEQTVPASLLDILLYSSDAQSDYLVAQESASKAVDRAIRETTVGASIDAMMDEFVEIVEGEKPAIEEIDIHKTFSI